MKMEKNCQIKWNGGKYNIFTSDDGNGVEIEELPRDEEGNYDFECLEALDLKLLNKQLKELQQQLNGI